MKKFFLTLLWYFLIINNSAFASLQDQIIPDKSTVLKNSWKWWFDPFDSVISYFKDFLFQIIWLIVIWVFIYFWYKLVSANWNSEELKKTITGFVYVIIWLAVISLAFVAVRLVSSLTF